MFFRRERRPESSLFFFPVIGLLKTPFALALESSPSLYNVESRSGISEDRSEISEELSEISEGLSQTRKVFLESRKDLP